MSNIGIIISVLSITSVLSLIITIYRMLFTYIKQIYVALVILELDLDDNGLVESLKERLDIAFNIFKAVHIRLFIIPIAYWNILEYKNIVFNSGYKFGSILFNTNITDKYSLLILSITLLILIYNTIKNTIEYFQINNFRIEFIEFNHQMDIKRQEEEYKNTRYKD